jgi:hypothetical protein
MGIVMTVPCRSYSAQTFDGCPACLDAALEAVTQAGLYLLGRAAPGLAGQTEGPVEMSYRLQVRLFDDGGVELAADEVDADQSVEAVTEPATQDDADLSDEGGDELETTMRLDDFQTIVDIVDLAPAGPDGASGRIAGNLLGFGHPVGRFTIEIAPGH